MSQRRPIAIIVANRKVALEGHRRKPTSRLLVKVVKNVDNAEIATYATSLRRNNTTWAFVSLVCIVASEKVALSRLGKKWHEKCR